MYRILDTGIREYLIRIRLKPYTAELYALVLAIGKVAIDIGNQRIIVLISEKLVIQAVILLGNVLWVEDK